MTNELREHISKLPIHSYVLPGNRTIIGQVTESNKDSVELMSAFSIEDYYQDDEDQVAKILEPIVPLTIDQKSIISRSHIIIETPAGFDLKNIYCKTILKYQIQSAIQKNMTSSYNLETIDKYSDRWDIQ